MRKRVILSLLAAVFISGCEPTAKEPPPRAETGQRERGTVDHYQIDPAFFTRGEQSLQQLVNSQLALRQATQAFLGNSDEQRWQALRQQWIKSHQQWHRSHFYLASSQQYPSLLPALTLAASNLHSTPISPGFIDGIPGYPTSGIVFDITVPMTTKALRGQHQSYSKEEVSIGLHAMEFLLWGNQLSDYRDGRSITQEEVFRGITQSQLPTPRRRDYLLLLTEMMVEDSRQLQLDWESGTQRMMRLRPSQKRHLVSGNGIRQLALLVNKPEHNHAQYSQDLSWQAALIDGVEKGIGQAGFSLQTAVELQQQLRDNSDAIERSAQQHQLTKLLAQAIVTLESLPDTKTPATSE